MKYRKILDNINIVLILLLFMSYISFDGTVSSMKPMFKYMTVLLFVFTIFRMILLKDFKIKSWKFLIVYGLLNVFAGLSTIWSIAPSDTIGTVKCMVLVLMVSFSFIQFIDSKEKLKCVLKSYVLYLTFVSFMLIFFEKNAPGTFLYGSIVGLYFNAIAHMLAIGTLISYYIFRSDKKKIYLILVAIFYYIIYLTGSRKGLIFPVVSIIGFEVLCMKFNVRNIIKLMCIGVISLIVVVALINTNVKLKNRVVNLFLSFAGQDVKDKSISEREFYTEEAKKLFKDNPILGVGAGGFAAYMEEINYSHVAYCHNNQLELLSTLGIIGFLIYYANYVIICFMSLKSIKKLRNIDTVLPLVFIVIFAVFEIGIVSYYRFEYVPIVCIFYIMARLNQNEKIEGEEK